MIGPHQVSVPYHCIGRRFPEPRVESHIPIISFPKEIFSMTGARTTRESPEQQQEIGQLSLNQLRDRATDLIRELENLIEQPNQTPSTQESFQRPAKEMVDALRSGSGNLTGLNRGDFETLLTRASELNSRYRMQIMSDVREGSTRLEPHMRWENTP